MGILHIFLLLLNQFLWAGLINIPLGTKYPLSSKKQIEFCWLAKDNSNTRELQKKIELYLKEQIQDRAQINISFVGLCLKQTNPMAPVGLAFYDAADNPPGLQAEINNVVTNSQHRGHPTTYSRGEWTYKNLTDSVLTSRFIDVSPTLIEQMSELKPQGREALLLSIALHESLHALGIAHEHDRSDSTCVMQSEVILDLQLQTYVGPYDFNSIMNYCKTHEHDFDNEGPIPLSTGDIQTLQSLYAR